VSKGKQNDHEVNWKIFWTRKELKQEEDNDLVIKARNINKRKTNRYYRSIDIL